MILRNQLLAALAAATCAMAPAAFSQEPPSPPPSAQDPDSADVGEPAAVGAAGPAADHDG